MAFPQRSGVLLLGNVSGTGAGYALFMLIYRVLSVFLVLALLDGAVASFGGAPIVRAGAIAAAALYLGVVALAWRRFPSVAAAVGALLLATLIAVAGIGAASSDAGLRLTAVSPDVLVALALGAALLLCGFGVARSQLPRALRLWVPIVAVVLALPFALAAFQGTLDKAFTGLPGWLGWAGVEIMLPIAFLVAVAAAVRSAVRREWSRAATVAIMGLALLACAQAGARAVGDRGMPSITAFEGGAAPAAAVSHSPAASGGLAAQGGLSGLMNNAQVITLGGASAASQAFGGTPSPGGDYAAKAVRLREQAQSIPRAGYDVAALAATLPNDPIALFHFVRDHISTDIYPGALRGPKGALMSWSANPTDRALLLAALLQAKGASVGFMHATLTDAQAAQIVALDGKPAPAASGAPTAIAPAAQTSPDKMESYVTATLQAANRQADAITAVLAANNAPLATGGAAPSNDDVRSHWWLRAIVGGQSVDLDPSLPSLESGAHLGTADASAPVDALPASEYATVRFHLIATTSGNDGAKERDVFDRTVRAADLVGKAVELWMVPQKPSDDPRTANVLVPSFAVGSSLQTGQPLEMKSADGSILSELRLEISTLEPRREPRIYRRWLLTPEQARGGAPAQHIAGNLALMVQTGPPNPAFVMSQMLESAAQYDSFQAINAARGAPSTVPGAIPLPLRVLAYTIRDGYFAQRIAENAGASVRFVVDRPQIAMQRLEYSSTPGSNNARSTFDIVDNAVAAYGSGAPRANLVRGIVDTEIERDIESATQGAYDLLAAGAQNGAMTRVLRTAPSAADATQRGIGETVANGSVALALNGTTAYDGHETLAWWDVDPASGNVVGRVTGGSGQALAEYGKMALTAANYASFFLSFANDVVNCKGVGSCMCSFFLDAVFFNAGFKMGLGATLVTLPVSLSLGAMC